MSYTLRPVHDSEKPELLKFARENPWKPSFPEPLLNRFLTELISSNDLIFDLHDEKGRVATAVMIDKISNASNDANLEIIGMRAGADLAAVVAEVLRLAKARAPTGKAGFQFSLLEDSPLGDELMNRCGLKYFYATYEMENWAIAVKEIARSRNIIRATKADANAVFDVLNKSFSKNPETSIPDRDSYNQGFLSSPQMHIYLWKDGGTICGFANLVEPHSEDSCEVRTIGVLPEKRGAGLGRDLLQHCLNETVRLGLHKCHLSVAVENDGALALYLSSGFAVTEKFRCFRALFR